MAKKLLNKLEKIIIGVGLTFNSYVMPALADNVSVEYKKTIENLDVDGDNIPEKFYISSIQESFLEGEVHKVVWKRNLVMKKNQDLGESDTVTILTTFSNEPEKISFYDYNKDKIIDIVYVIRNQEKNIPLEKKYEKYVLYGKGDGNFGSPEFIEYSKD